MSLERLTFLNTDPVRVRMAGTLIYGPAWGEQCGSPRAFFTVVTMLILRRWGLAEDIAWCAVQALKPYIESLAEEVVSNSKPVYLQLIDGRHVSLVQEYSAVNYDTTDRAFVPLPEDPLIVITLSYNRLSRLLSDTSSDNIDPVDPSGLGT